MSKDSFSAKVLKTAFGVAFRRTFTGIPHSEKVFSLLMKIEPWDDARLKGEFMKFLIPYFEARYLLTDKMLRQESERHNICQVAEVAAGLSMRGKMYVAGKSHNSYIEIDQPEMVTLKQRIVQGFAGIIAPGYWQIQAGDALEIDSLRAAISDFDKNKQIAVINEGLMVYFSPARRAVYSKNIGAILREFGGEHFRNNVWITPDIAINGAIDYPGREIVEKEWHASVGCDLSGNFFASEDAARESFENLGLAVESHSLNEVRDEMQSPRILGLDEDIVQGVIGKSPLFVMRAA